MQRLHLGYIPSGKGARSKAVANAASAEHSMQTERGQYEPSSVRFTGNAQAAVT